MSRLLIKNARIINPANGIDKTRDLALMDGKITDPCDNDTWDQTIDASGLWLVPGLVDLSTRLSSSGHGLDSHTCAHIQAALHSGTTHLCLEPDHEPVSDHVSMVEYLLEQTAVENAVHIEVLGALTSGLKGNALSAMGSLKAAGVRAVSSARAPHQDSNILRRAMQYADSLGLVVILQSLDASLANGMVHAGNLATRLGLPGIPVAAEAAGLARDLALVEDTGCRTHFSRITSARGVELIANAKQRGLPVSADVSIHHLFLSEQDLAGFNTMAHIQPPLRSHDDRLALRQAVSDGTIDCICSAHEPVDMEYKLRPLPSSLPGASSLDTWLGLMLQLVEDGDITPVKLAELASKNPADLLALEDHNLEAGSPGDFFLLDPDIHLKVESTNWSSSCRNSPYLGWVLPGKVRYTFLNGQIAYQC